MVEVFDSSMIAYLVFLVTGFPLMVSGIIRIMERY